MICQAVNADGQAIVATFAVQITHGGDLLLDAWVQPDCGEILQTLLVPLPHGSDRNL